MRHWQDRDALIPLPSLSGLKSWPLPDKKHMKEAMQQEKKNHIPSINITYAQHQTQL